MLPALTAARPPAHSMAQRCLRRCLWPSLAFCLLLGAAPLAADDAPDEQLAQVNAAISDIESWLSAAQQDLSTQEQSLRRITRDLRQRQQQIADNRQRINALSEGVFDLEQEAARLEAEIEAQQALVAQALRASWMAGREPMLKLLLNQQDPAELNRMLQYYAHFNQSRLQQIGQFRERQLRLSDTESAIADQRQALQQQNAQLEEQLFNLEIDQQQRAELIAELEAEMASRDDELARLIADREHLQALIDEINRVIVDIPAPEDLQPFSAARGELPWPADGRALNRFGENYSNGNLQRQGLIIGAPADSPVRAVHHGRVVFADWLRGSGLLVVVDHGNGYITLYAHNSALIKQQGDWVNRGEPLATAGRDAGMDSPGVYFELRHNGRPQNPVEWFVSP